MSNNHTSEDGKTYISDRAGFHQMVDDMWDDEKHSRLILISGTLTKDEDIIELGILSNADDSDERDIMLTVYATGRY